MIYRRKIILVGLTLGVITSSMADESKLLNVIKLNYETMNSSSNEEFKNMRFEEFHKKLGFEHDLLIVEKKDMDNFKDAQKFYWNQLSPLLKNYCNTQNGILFGHEGVGNIFHPMGQKWTRNISYSDFGREMVCINKGTPLFFASFDVFLKKCLFSCDYAGYDFKQAEFVLSNNQEKLSIYKTKYNEFIKNERINEDYKKKAEEERASFEQLKKAKIQEIAAQKKILRDRGGNIVMDFYTGFNGPSVCEKSCKSLNEFNTGYATIEDAVKNGWFISQVLADSNQVVAYSLDEYGLPKDGNGCQCNGKKYFMQKNK